MKYTSTLILLIIYICALHATKADLYCKDESGANVDWYIVYKLPKINKVKNSFFADGLKYSYISGPSITGKSASKEWKLSPKQVGDQNSMFANTLLPVYKESMKYTSLIYNDDPAGGEGNTYWAHAKGVLAMDSKTGFFLTHSIPRFPLAFNESRYEYPLTASNNGQTALCISFKTPEEANNILLHLQTLRPNIYYSNDAGVLKDSSVFKNLVDKVALKESSAQRIIKSNKGQEFTAFGKNSKAGGDLYGANIAPSLKTDLSVETWRRGAGGPLPSNCTSKQKIVNVDSLEMKFKSGTIMTTDEWLYTQDHAKWAAADSSTSPFVCIADINRMESQFKRGGGALCLNDIHIWQQFRNVVKGVEACPK